MTSEARQLIQMNEVMGSDVACNKVESMRPLKGIDVPSWLKYCPGEQQMAAV